MSATFTTPKKIITGCGSFQQCADEVKSFSDKCLLVTGAKSMQRAGVVSQLMGQLRERGVETVHFAGITSEPTVEMVDEGRAILRENGCGVVVGLGGGSAMDAAKAIAGLANMDEPTRSFHEGAQIEREGIPFIAVPTTSGTGAEVTMNAVISDPERRIKKSIRHPSFIARVAIVDAELTVSCPPRVTAAAGLDALTQAMESFTSIHATPLTEALSARAIQLIAPNLERAYRDGKDIAAREGMSYGSLMAGMALANARLGVVHGLAHPLGVRYGIPHGLVCGVLLPQALKLNKPHIPEKYETICDLVGKDAIQFVEELLSRLDMPRDLKQFNIPQEDFGAIIEESMPSGSLKANPKKITEEDLLTILKAVV